jgi:hypothetical protein
LHLRTYLLAAGAFAVVVIGLLTTLRRRTAQVEPVAVAAD